MNRVNYTHQRGYVAVAVMLLIAVIILGTTITVISLGIGEGQSSLALSNGEATLHFVEGCMEDALLKIRANAAYAGGTTTQPEGTCTISVSQVGTTYTVTATSTATTYRRTIQAVVTRSSSLTISSWKEM